MRLIVISAVLFAAACGDSGNKVDADPFDTFQLCYNEHHGTEMISAPCAIEICCIDHPIGGVKANMVCGDTAASCSTYVNANLQDGSDATLSTDITNACGFYVNDSGRGSGSGAMCSG
jgi:hypothetical protein